MAVDATRPIAGLSVPASAREALRWLWWSRVVVFGASMFAIAIWGYSGHAGAFDPLGLTTPFGHTGDTLVAPFARWDSRWYLDIAQHGYGSHVAFGADGNAGQIAAFFPLYPLLVWIVSLGTGSALIAGIVVSAVCAWGALALLHRLTEIELGADAARHTVALLAFSPMALFFSAVYTESLFLLLSVGAVVAARTGRWPWAMACGVLAAATRNLGVLLVIPLALLWWQRRDPWRDLLWLIPIPAGLLLFCWYLTGHGAAFNAPFTAPKKYWQRVGDGPLSAAKQGIVAAWDGARQLLHGSETPVYWTKAGGHPFNVAWRNLSNFLFLLPLVPMFVGTVRRLPIAYWAYALVALLLALSYPVHSEPLISLPRYELVMFPLFMWLGWWVSRAKPLARYAVYGVCVVGLVAYSAQFATFHWVA